MAGAVRFPILFTGVNKALAAFGLTQQSSWVDVSDTEVVAHMGWAFHAVIQRSSIASVSEDTDRIIGWGVHGWRGDWLVNGSSKNVVRIEIDPPGTARSIGFTVNLKRLRVSVVDPVAFQRSLAAT